MYENLHIQNHRDLGQPLDHNSYFDKTDKLSDSNFRQHNEENFWLDLKMFPNLHKSYHGPHRRYDIVDEGPISNNFAEHEISPGKQ